MNSRILGLLVTVCAVWLPGFPGNAQGLSDGLAPAAIAVGAHTASTFGNFVYTNNDRTPNSVSGFIIASNGALTPVPGSPFATGGNGFTGGFFATNRITSAIVKNFLYASNTTTNNVSGFSIEPATGVLTLVPGSPFPTGGRSSSGISLAATPDDKFLITANGASNNLTVFAIASNGSLSPVPGSPFAIGAPMQPDGLKVTADGKFLAVALAPTAVAMFNISATGALTPVSGSPFTSTNAAGLDCNCASNKLFVGEATTADRVDVYNISASGALSAVPGSPFSGPGSNSNVPVLSPDDSKLFVSNQFSNTVTVFNVAASGALSVVAGSPFANPASAISPSGMATNQQGTFLYVANIDNLISGFTVEATGVLAPVPGSPFNNGFPGGFGLISLTTFPPKNCCPVPAVDGGSATPNVLWPINHNMVDVTINYSVTEPCPFSCVLTVASNEPVNGVGDGNTSPDWKVVDAHHVQVRAERTGTNGERVYTVTVTCTNDTNKLSSSKSVNIVIPHDQR
jgi:6-phosphogluconolactonase